MMTERLLTLEQVAEFAQVSVKTVRRAVAAGHLEASRLTQTRGGWRVHPDAIDDWLYRRSNRAEQAPAAPAAPNATQAPRSSPSAPIDLRPRRSSGGRLTVTPGMGRAA